LRISGGRFFNSVLRRDLLRLASGSAARRAPDFAPPSTRFKRFPQLSNLPILTRKVQLVSCHPDSMGREFSAGEERMKAKPPGKMRDGAQCKVIGGVHAGKSGVVRDINTSKTGHVTITVVQRSGERFKTLAKHVI
jgi:hypothetical protein